MYSARETGAVTSFCIAALFCVILLFSLVVPPDASALADTPGYCRGCHVMEAQYEAWEHSGAHRRIRCVDCHLPNENMVLHYVWKTIDGAKDVLLYYSGRVPEQIRLTAHGQAAVQANCIRCHETAVTMIDKERRCRECHRRITHKLVGTIETL